MSTQKHILVISYTFPPYPGIGGRRWSKFAKYLKRKGYIVHVICSENPHEKTSEWVKDIEGIDVHRLPLNYPQSLILFPQTIFGKIQYRLDKLIVQLRSKGNYYDRALFWKKQLAVKATDLINKYDIKNVMATGAPFHLLSHTVKLKEVFPDLNVIIDFRDFWAKDLSLSALGGMSPKRVANEIEMERNTVQRANHILTVADEMTSYFEAISKNKNCHTILNGFDEEDFISLNDIPKGQSEKIKFVYTGNLYNETNYVFLPFADALAKLKSENQDLYSQVEFNFYGTYPKEYLGLVKSRHLDVVTFHNSIPLSMALQKINDADYCMLFLNNTYSFSLSTKFCEYIALKKKIVLFSSEGRASEFIKENKLGFWVDPAETYACLLDLIRNKELMSFELLELREKFSVKNISSELEKLFV
ncbi:MAG: hypothetical protein K0S26_1732 [Bacteroidota bacterium]|nr:hypothetical protein [Bacteroidota bacterium]